MSQGLIQGSMREAPLPDIIQLVSQGGKTGCFHVTEDPKRAKIYLKAGRIVHAVTLECEGLDALYQVALWLDGSYHFEEVEVTADASITKPNPFLLMEMHRRMDEWRVIRPRLGALDLYPVSTLLPGETATGVHPREARLATILTGYYTVEELSALLGKPVLSLAKDIYGLIMAGHAVMKGVRSGKRPQLPGREAPAPAAEPRVPATVPALERMQPTVPEPMPVPDAPIFPAAGPQDPALDPVKLAKLRHFAQRIIQTGKGVLPAEHHELLNQLLARAHDQLAQGEGPEAVKNLALAVSRGAVEAGCAGELVRTLNSQLKALFSK
jgi:hypothetical protein